MTIKNLVLSGGGVRGLAIVGALKHFHNNLTQLESITGISVGAILGFIYLIGYTPDEIIEITTKKDFKDLLNVSVLSLIKDYGIDNGEKLLTWIKQLSKAKGISKDITFLELYTKTGINLRVGVTNLTESRQEIFDYTTYPNLHVILALRMSFSVPFVFSCVKFNDCIYVDGGITDNFPIELYAKQADETLGIQLVANSKKCDVDSFKSYTASIIKCLKVQLDDKILDNNTLYIPEGRVASMNFELTSSDKKQLVELGYEAAKEFSLKQEVKNTSNSDS